MVRAARRWILSAVVCGALGAPAWAGVAEDAQAAFDRGEYAAAVSLYQKAADQSPALREDDAFMSAWARAEARVAYDAGTKLHKEHEYDAAVEQFMQAIAKDSTFELAYAALEDARVAGISQHLLVSLEAADQGDLLASKRRLEQSLVLGGGADEQVHTALTSITEPEKVFDQATLAKLTEARRLASDRQWELAETQLKTLVQQAPLLLPARAELSRASRIKTLSITMTDEAAALIAQQRLSPALEKLAGATSVWPYNKRAVELLEGVEAKIKRVNAMVEQADKLRQQEDWRGAYEKLAEALAIDPSNPDARALRSEVRVGLVSMLADQARSALAAGDLEQARGLIERGDLYWSNNRWTRRAMADYQLALADRADQAGHVGEAYLRTLLASRDASVDRQLGEMERAAVKDARATYAYDLVPSSPAIGVGSTELINALTVQTHADPEPPASCIVFLLGNTPLDQGRQNVDQAVDLAAPSQARYRVRVQITATDIDLRQRNNGGLTLDGVTLGTDSNAFNSHYWEKFGSVEAAVLIIDQATGQEIERWNSYRWANYTDRQQYTIGNTWHDSYWTLPTDEEIASRLARDLAAQIQPRVVESLTLAKARAMKQEARAIAGQDPAGALNLKVASAILAGQVQPRQARTELWRMARELDERRPTPTE